MMKVAAVKVAAIVACVVLIVGTGAVVIVKQVASAEETPVAATSENHAVAISTQQPATEPATGSSLLAEYNALGDGYANALKLAGEPRRKALEGSIGPLQDFQKRAGKSFLAVRALSLHADVEIALNHSDSAANLLQAARDALKSMSTHDANEDEQANYVSLKSAETETKRGHYPEAIAFYKEAVKGKNHSAMFGPLAVKGLAEPVLKAYGAAKWQEEYQRILREFVEAEKEIPQNSWSRAAGEFLEVSNRLFEESKIPETDYARCLDLVDSRSARLLPGDKQLFDGLKGQLAHKGG